jgi:hypothetical protein
MLQNQHNVKNNIKHVFKAMDSLKDFLQVNQEKGAPLSILDKLKA